MSNESTSTICQQCKIGWPIRGGDTFCGYCSAKVTDYELDIVGGPAYIDELDNASLRLSLINKGSAPVKIKPIPPKVPWATLAETDPVVITVENSPHEIGITIDSSNPLIQSLRRLRCRIGAQRENENQTKSEMLEIFPPPDFGFAEERVTFEHSKAKQKASVELNVLIQKSSVVFEKILAEDCKDWLEPQTSELGKELKPGDNLVITALIDLQKMPTKDETEVTLSFELKGRENKVTKSFKLVPVLAPELRVDEAKADGRIKTTAGRIQITATKDKKQDFQLSLRNSGDGEIDLAKLDCKRRPDWLELSPSKRVLRKDEEATLTISVDGKASSEGENSFELIHPEKDNIFEFPFVLEITVRSLPEYPHYLSVDFGTTNSCCVFVNQNNEPESIILDEYNDPAMSFQDKVIPSTITYTGEDNSELKYLVGRNANMDRMGRYARNHFRSIKRLIGSDEDFYINVNSKRIPLKPYQISADIIRHLLDKAEERLEQKIVRCVVTHPTKFTLREVDELRRIYTDELGIKEKDILMLDEATAASLDYIVSRNKEKKGEPETYYIIVYDFGGGTTDIAVLLVNAQKGFLKIEPLDVGGHRMLGGDDITELIVQHILKEYQKKLETKQPLVSIDIPFCPMTERYEESGDSALDQKVRGNSYALYDTAERIKIDLSNKMSEEIEKLSNPTAEEIKKLSEQINIEMPIGLSVSVGGELKDIEDALPVGEQGITIEYSLIKEWLSPRLDNMLEQIEGMLKDMEEHPKVILLAGQSSAIPLVQQKMEGQFSDAQVVSAENLKECVALGSIRYGDTVIYQAKDKRSEPIEVVDFTSKTHSAYGIAIIDAFTEKEFQAVIPKRVYIPDDSHGTFTMRFRKQEAIVPVYENTGVKPILKGNEEIKFVGNYIYDFSKDGVSESELQEVELEMSMGLDEQIHVAANINSECYKFIRPDERKG